MWKRMKALMNGKEIDIIISKESQKELDELKTKLGLDNSNKIRAYDGKSAIIMRKQHVEYMSREEELKRDIRYAKHSVGRTKILFWFGIASILLSYKHPLAYGIFGCGLIGLSAFTKVQMQKLLENAENKLEKWYEI